MPYVSDMEGMAMANPLVSQPFVIGTNTFSQAQQKIQQVTDGVPADAPMFVPPQILHPPSANTGNLLSALCHNRVPRVDNVSLFCRCYSASATTSDVYATGWHDFSS